MSLFGKDATSFSHLDLGILCHSSLQILSSSVRLDGKRWWTAIFRSLQRCSIGFKSGLWLGHSRTVTELLWSHSFVILAVCLGSLSCWKVNLRPSLRSWALWRRFSSRISLYLAAFIFPSIATSRPVPAAEKHPHSMMLPPPCFTVGTVLDRWWAAPGFLHTYRLELRPKSYWIMEATVLLGTLSAAEFFFVTLARSVPCHNSVSELFRQFLWPHDSHLLWHALWAVRSYIDRCVAFLIKSNQYNQTQLDSNEGVEPSQGWSEEMDSTWVKYMSVTAKGLNT